MDQDPTSPLTDRQLMELAVEQAKLSVREPGRKSPSVGAVLSVPGTVTAAPPMLHWDLKVLSRRRNVDVGRRPYSL